MRNPIDVLNSLSEKSKNPSYRFQRLYRNLYNPEFYMLAYKNIYANDGSMTPGMDGTTLDGMSSRRIDGIIASLRDHSYQPKPARREYIPKKSDPNKKRPLGIPSANAFMSPTSLKTPMDFVLGKAAIRRFSICNGHSPGQSGL